MTGRVEICGWQVESALPLPELPPVEGPIRPEPDLTIAFGSVPDELPGISFKGPLLQVGSDGACRLAIPCGLVFLVDPEGRRVTIATALPPESPTIRAFLLGNVLSLVCLRRQLLPLHACCIGVPTAKGEVAIAFTAPSGSGKSTLASAFVGQGCRLLADDLTVLSHRAGEGMRALPTFARLRLWRDAMERFRYPTETAERVRDETEKYSVSMSAAFCREPLPLAAIYHYARVEDERHAEFRPVQGIEGTARFLEAIYQRRSLLCAAANDRAAHVALITQAVGAIPEHWMLTQPTGLAKLDDLVARLIGRHRAATAA